MPQARMEKSKQLDRVTARETYLLNEANVSSPYVLANIMTKAAYVALGAGVLVFLTMLFLTTIHP
jgi:hypothetical protein